MQPHTADIVVNLMHSGCDQVSVAVTRGLSVGQHVVTAIEHS